MSTAPNVRHVEIHFGDDIKRISLRELGNASRWTELVILNGLRPPYIAAEAMAGVLTYGDYIKVPSPGSTISADADPSEVFLTDVRVVQGNLLVENGDVAIVTGVPNFTQALTHRVVVEKRELAFHPSFGCWVRSVIGAVNGPTSAQLAAFYVKSALLEDDRVESVVSCVAEVIGDQISVTATVEAISGRPVDMTVVV